MPERSFGRTVRYRRTKLGLSQTKLAELVGRSTTTIRSWERDKSRPNDPQVLAALAAVLGIDEKHLFDKAEVDRPAQSETSPTVEQALATLSLQEIPLAGTGTPPDAVDDEPDDRSVFELPGRKEPASEPVLVRSGSDGHRNRDQSVGPAVEMASESGLAAVGGTPAYVAPPDPYNQTPLTPTLADISYIEDTSQRQLYRVRNLATVVASVVLVIAFIWAVGEGVGAFSEWWDAFFGNLRL